MQGLDSTGRVEVASWRMSQDAWDPKQYHRFQNERSQPFFDLLSLVDIARGAKVVDLGCGTGELTKILHERTGAATTRGLDNSEAMLKEAANHAGPGLEFIKGDLASLEPGSSYDLIFSNAALQWVNDHANLLKRIASHLRPGGQLAVQVPANHDHLSHRLAAEVAGEEPFRTALGGYQRVSPVLSPEDYTILLYDLGFERIQVRLQVYLHELGSSDDVIEWVKGTCLTDYSKRLPKELFEKFLTRYRERLIPQLGHRKPFPYPFKRILMSAFAKK